jgi:hypothetical protein
VQLGVTEVQSSQCISQPHIRRTEVCRAVILNFDCKCGEALRKLVAFLRSAQVQGSLEMQCGQGF